MHRADEADPGRSIRNARIMGALVGLSLGIGLLAWSVAVDVVDLPGSSTPARPIDCSGESGTALTDCQVFKALSEGLGSATDQIEGAILTGIASATIVLVVIGIVLAGWIERRHLGRRPTRASFGPAQPQAP